jgi:hypothetical protein
MCASIKFSQNPKGLERGPWWGNLATSREYREHAALVGLAPDPRTDHECGDSRDLAIPFLDACMAQRLPEKGSLNEGWVTQLPQFVDIMMSQSCRDWLPVLRSSRQHDIDRTLQVASMAW